MSGCLRAWSLQFEVWRPSTTTGFSVSDSGTHSFLRRTYSRLKDSPELRILRTSSVREILGRAGTPTGDLEEASDMRGETWPAWVEPDTECWTSICEAGEEEEDIPMLPLRCKLETSSTKMGTSNSVEEEGTMTEGTEVIMVGGEVVTEDTEEVEEATIMATTGEVGEAITTMEEEEEVIRTVTTEEITTVETMAVEEVVEVVVEVVVLGPMGSLEAAQGVVGSTIEVVVGIITNLGVRIEVEEAEEVAEEVVDTVTTPTVTKEVAELSDCPHISDLL